jgi:hypothetical protein
MTGVPAAVQAAIDQQLAGVGADLDQMVCALPAHIAEVGEANALADLLLALTRNLGHEQLGTLAVVAIRRLAAIEGQKS